MRIEDLPKWMHAMPVLIGVALALIGMHVFPMLGLRNVLGPIVGLPVGLMAGFAVLAIVAKSKGV